MIELGPMTVEFASSLDISVSEDFDIDVIFFSSQSGGKKKRKSQNLLIDLDKTEIQPIDANTNFCKCKRKTDI